ncbi:hypothetical protein, partial [Oscillibacter sp. CU971]|uniref:hypothetical protein n=1 Tax=Oscillibacter sp. CU971 TaxID=2780102 RepID=UPI00195CE98B
LHKLFAPLLLSALYSSGFSLLVQLLRARRAGGLREMAKIGKAPKFPGKSCAFCKNYLRSGENPCQSGCGVL